MRPIRLATSALLLLLAAMIVLCSCGDDNPSNPDVTPPEPEPLEAVDGTLSLPDGWAGDPATLQAVNSHASAGCDGCAFTVDCFTDDRQLVAVRGDDGPLLMAWFGAGADTINTRTTAEVLLYYALGSWMLPHDGQTAVRGLIAELTTELDGVTAALDQALIDHPTGLPDNQTAVHDALQALVDDLLAEAMADKGVIIEPETMQSGVEVLNDGGINKVVFKNSYRRRGYVYIWEESWTDADDVTYPSDLDSALYAFEVPPVDGFAGSFATILGYLVGTGVAYEPKLSAPFELPVHDDAKETEYAIDLVGFGLEPIDDPSQYTSAELEMGAWIGLKGLVIDYFLPMLLNMSGALSDDGPFSDVAGSELAGHINTYLGYLVTDAPAFYQAYQNDDWWGGVLALLNMSAVNDEFQEQTIHLAQLMLLESGMAIAQIEEITDLVDTFLHAVKVVDIIGGLADNIIQGVHFQNCQDANTWELTVTAPVIHIEPREATIEVYNTQLLTCVLDDDTGGPPTGVAYAFHWSCGGNAGVLVNPAHPTDTSNDFYTSYDYVHYEADRGVAGSDDVICELYYKVGTTYSYIAADTMTMDVTKREVVLPDTLRFCGEDEITLEPHLDPPYTDDEVVVWSWRSSGSAGTLTGPAGQIGSWDHESDPEGTYASDATGGSGELLCIASLYLDGAYSPIDTATVVIQVGAAETYSGEVMGGAWVTPDGEGCWWTVYLRFPKTGGATHYHVHMYNFYDHAGYYGTEHSAYGPPWPVRGYETDSEVYYYLCGGGGSGSEPPWDSLAWGLSRFDGAISEITPVCPD